MHLIDTLDNTYHANNSSPALTNLPGTFYVLNHDACYFPAAVDPDGDSVHFALTGAFNGTSVCENTPLAANYTTAFPAWPGQPITGTIPLQVTAGTFSLDELNGSLCFIPNQIQNSSVVYNVREYRNDTFIGNCQRELTILVHTATVPGPSGAFNSATAGVINDSTHFTVCTNTGPFSIFMNPVEPGSTNNITVTPLALPPGLTFTTVGNGTHTPACTISWSTTAVAPGTYPFYVTFTDDACPTESSLTRAFYIIIAPLSDPGTIGGPTNVCTGSSINLTETVTGGVWSTTAGNITVSSTGIVTAISPGTAILSYTATSSGCEPLSSTYAVTVNPTPAPTTGSTGICVGGTTELTNTTPDGIWTSSSPGIVSTTGSGPVTAIGISPGTSAIAYTLASGCFVTKTVTVYLTPTPITGPLSVCTGATTTLASAPSGGTWTSSNISVASVAGAGPAILGGIPGTATINYTLGTGCQASAIVTVFPLPAPGPVSGPSSVCVASTISLSDPVPGGAWSSSSVHAAVSSAGVVIGLSGGTATISYTITNSCAAVAATKTVTIDIAPVAGTITGPSAVCVGSAIALTATPGGVWSTTTANASITTAGLLTGITAGTTVVSYSATNSCGTAAATKPVTVLGLPVVSPLTGPDLVCVGSSIALSDMTAGGTWSSTSANATVTPDGLVTGVTAGTATISYAIINSCGTEAATYIITTNPAPDAGAIAGSPIVCAGALMTLTDAAPDGIWSSTSGNAIITPTGMVSGIIPGTATISYTVTNICGTAVATYPITVNPAPDAGSISGPSIVCVASSILLTDAAVGGTWSSTATNTSTSATGLATGITAGTTTISYSVTNSCGTAAATHSVTINPLPDAGTITGPPGVCSGSSITLTDAASGGVWSSTTADATISAGLVTGVSAGTTIISYTVTNSCGVAAATKPILINLLPDAGTITGPSLVCEGATIILNDAAATGIWTSSNGHASAGPGGMITGITAGTVTISYTVTNVCGTAVATHDIIVDLPPAPGAIAGPAAVCVAGNISLTDASTGGLWTSTPLASVSPAGIVTGIAPGIATISYSLTNACGTVTAVKVISINPLPNAGIIGGPNVVCEAAVILLPETVAGGVWSSSNTNAIVSATGIVSGVAPGSATISYSVTNSCGTAMVAKVVTINPLPVITSIVAPSFVCVGIPVAFLAAPGTGTWSSPSAIVSITPTGIVTGLSPGSAPIKYSYTNSCGTRDTLISLTVSPQPAPGVITGPAALCTGSSVLLSDAAPGGTWSSTPAISVSSPGVVTGLSSGTARVSYSVTNMCGTAVATYVISVNPLPNPITGSTNICTGLTATLTNATAGGTWSSSNISVAAIGSATGVVTGIVQGATTIFYSLPTGCQSLIAFVVNPMPDAGTITGPSAVCTSVPLILSDAVPGGTWTSSSTNVLVSPGGVVIGTAAGTAVISYTVTNFCGTDIATKAVTIDPAPNAGPISGSTTVCALSSITLETPVAGGSWTTGNMHASVSPTGVVTGISAGTVTVSYTATNSCGTDVATHIITVNALPLADTITGPSVFCTGSSITLSEVSGGGAWSSPNPGVAVSATGGVYGITAGTAIISYSVTNPCGTAVATRIVTINPLPVPGTLSGPSVICQDSAFLLTSSVPGGIWTTSTPTVATVTSWGLVFAVGGGTATISYTVALAGCTNFVNKVITVNPLPNAGILNHPAPVCLGTPIVMAASLPGGVWSAGDPSVSITSTGVVTGLAAGSYYVSYTVTNSCGSATALQLLTFYPLPDPGTITGPPFICMGSNATYVETALIGTWSASGMATVSPTGIVTGTAPGTATISFTATNGVCTSLNTKVISINPTPAVGPIGGPTGACLDNTLTLTNITPGGIWSSSGAAVSVSPAGVVTGLTAGTGIISYELTNACGTAKATQTVEIFVAPPAGTITGPANMCLGQSQTLTNGASGGIWSSGNGSIAIVGSSTGEVLGIAAGTTMITYTVSAGPGCTNYATYPVTVSPVPNAGTISTPSGFCRGATFNVTPTLPGGTWTTSDGTIITIGSNGSATAAAPGTAIITYSIGANGCAAQATIAVTILSAPAFTLGSSITNPACFDATNGGIATTITGASGPVTYSWSNGSTDASLTNIAAGTYTVQITETNTFCKMADVFTITAPDAIAIVPVITNDDCNKSAGKISVAVTGGMQPYTYQWSNNSTSAEASNLAAGTYSLSVTDINTCRKDASLIVADDSCLEIVIHDAITPNGDGVNDKWIIEGLDRYPNNLIQVFDKWGDLIFEERNYNNTWVSRGKDGTVVPDGTYFYLLKLYADTLPGGLRVVTGSILIKR